MNHPPLEQLAQHLHVLAKLIDTHADHNRTDALNGKCRCAPCRAHLLAEHGYPAGTLGNGPRSSDSTSSTERNATLTTNPFAGIDQELARLLRVAWHTGLRIQTCVDRIVAHAPDDDPVPAGTGPCTIRTCDHVCRPRRNPDDRLRSGLCPTCWAAWQRHLVKNRSALLTDWKITRTAALRPRPTTH